MTDFVLDAPCKGHRQGVLSLIAWPENVFASGSEDRTVRVWDIRASPRRAQHCICECFPSSVDSLALNPKDNNYMFAASGTHVFVFDLRLVGASGVLTKTPRGVVNVYGQGAAGEDKAAASDNEINALQIDRRGGHMAVGDDEGNVMVLALDPACPRETPVRWNLLRRLGGRGGRGVHSSIVGTVAFKPNSSRELVSGGFDCVLCSWDFMQGRPGRRINFGTASAAGSTSPSQSQTQPQPQAQQQPAVSQLFNPPCVHAVAYTSSGRTLLAALGDGSLRALRSNDLTLLHSVEAAHNAMASCLVVLPTPTPTLTPSPSPLRTAGAGAGARAGAVVDVALTAGVDGWVRGWAVTETSGSGSGSGSGNSLAAIAPCFAIDHGRKINAIACFSGMTMMTMTTMIEGDRDRMQALPSHVVVAGVGGDVDVYQRAEG